jgi:hypothetical protein
MNVFDELMQDVIEAGPGPNHVIQHNGVHPKGWEPGIAWDGRAGELSTGPLAERPTDWNKLLEVWDLDPKVYEVIEPVQFRAWDAAVGEGRVQRMYYYKAPVITKRFGLTLDVEDMLDEIRHYKSRTIANTTGPMSFVWMIADLQVGKSDGDGTPGTMRRFLQAVEDIKERVKALRKLGREIGTLYVAGVGDCLEGVIGHYAQQLHRVDLNMTQQVRVIRRLLVRALKELCRYFDKVVIVAVPGNHGEAIRIDGKSATDFSDNWDVECFVQAYEIISENPAFSHVSLVVPTGQDLTLTLDISGTIVTFAHGHMFPRAKDGAMLWWAKQAHGLQQAGMSTLLLSGHLHHLKIEQQGAKTFIQAPALDGGSDWFRNMTGQDAPSGTVTLVVGDGKWSDLAIL